MEDYKHEIAWLKEAANYFKNRPTNGEDSAHWANVYNSQFAASLADRLSGAAPSDIEMRMRSALLSCREALPIAKSWAKGKGNCDLALGRIDKALNEVRAVLNPSKAK